MCNIYIYIYMYTLGKLLLLVEEGKKDKKEEEKEDGPVSCLLVFNVAYCEIYNLTGGKLCKHTAT